MRAGRRRARAAGAQYDHPPLPRPVGAGGGHPAHPGGDRGPAPRPGHLPAHRLPGPAQRRADRPGGGPAGDPDRLFSPVAALRVLSGPDETAWIDPPGTDVGNATALARRRSPTAAPGCWPTWCRAVSSMSTSSGGRRRRASGSPRSCPRTRPSCWPWPSRWSATTRTCRRSSWSSTRWTCATWWPHIRPRTTCCPAGAAAVPAGPPVASWTRIRPITGTGCSSAASVRCSSTSTSTAARRRRSISAPRTGRAGPGPVLTKCCLLERGLEVHGTTAVVPWGANLDEVRAALRLLCGLPAAPAPLSGRRAHDRLPSHRLGHLRAPVDHARSLPRCSPTRAAPRPGCGSWPPWPRPRPRSA